MKSLQDQIKAMKRRWPGFIAYPQNDGSILWIGDLTPIEVRYTLTIRFGLAGGDVPDSYYWHFPEVRVVSPRLRPVFDAAEEAPLPHVYFDSEDLSLSPLCLFDPAASEWSPDDLIANTTVPWTADWLACYEIWLATGRWQGGGRHMQQAVSQE